MPTIEIDSPLDKDEETWTQSELETGTLAYVATGSYNLDGFFEHRDNVKVEVRVVYPPSDSNLNTQSTYDARKATLIPADDPDADPTWEADFPTLTMPTNQAVLVAFLYNGDQYLASYSIDVVIGVPDAPRKK